MVCDLKNKALKLAHWNHVNAATSKRLFDAPIRGKRLALQRRFPMTLQFIPSRLNIKKTADSSTVFP